MANMCAKVTSTYMEFTLAFGPKPEFSFSFKLCFIIPHTYEKWKRFFEHLFLLIVSLAKKNCYVSSSVHLTQQFSCINSCINNMMLG